MSMNILLAVDGSPYTQKMLAYLAEHPDILGTAHNYSALTVQPQLPARARAALGKAMVDEYYAEESAKVLDAVCAVLAQSGVQVRRISKVGAVAACIVQAVEEGRYDLLVMGTHGHGALGRLVMGSVSTQVLATSQVPVLLIR